MELLVSPATIGPFSNGCKSTSQHHCQKVLVDSFVLNFYTYVKYASMSTPPFKDTIDLAMMRRSTRG